MLRSLKSPESYFQSAFRVQSPWSYRKPDGTDVTDFREEALKDVIESLDSDLFARVTGLTVADFRLLNSIGVFNAQHMNAAIYQFKWFENSSPHYADETLPEETGHHVGLWNTTINASELGGDFEPVSAPS